MSKKAAVLTVHRANNFGAVLQAYALQTFLNNNGFKVDIINYLCPFIENLYGYFPLRKGNALKNIIKSLLLIPVVFLRRRNFDGFRLKFLKTTAPVTRAELKNLNGSYDMFITGSDQVFNGRLTNYDTSYFLDFVDSPAKKASYAASFGLTELTKQEEALYTPLLTDFDNLLLREKEGQDLLKKLTGKEAPTVLDPVFLLTKEEWADIAIMPKEKNYILVYVMEKEKSIMDFAKQLSQKTGLKIIYLFFNPLHGVKDKSVIAAPQEYLGYFMAADYIVTNSFHGAAFAIKFNKRFFVGMLRSLGSLNSRLNHLLKTAKLESRIIDENSINNTGNVDFSAANAAIAEQTQKSARLITDILK